MSLAQLQRCLRHDHKKTTEISAGHIKMGTKKPTDCLADFLKDKSVYSRLVDVIRTGDP